MKWHHNSYSEEAIAEMQKEAEERVRRMQSRARLMGEDTPPLSPLPGRNPPSKTEPSPFPFKTDNDTFIILALLWLLWNEKADSKLLLALIYILLQ